MEIKYNAEPGAFAPEYQTSGAAGADVRAFIGEDVCIDPGERRLIPTGLSVEIPEGFEIQVRPRSGLALRQGITVLNTPGTIDADYRGSVGIVLVNLGNERFIVHPGDRIAQFVVAPVIHADFRAVSSLSETGRGAGGYGSTGAV